MNLNFGSDPSGSASIFFKMDCADEDFCWEDYFNALIPITGTDMLDIDDKLHDVI